MSNQEKIANVNSEVITEGVGVSKQNHNDIFISENDTFEVTIKYNSKNGHVTKVEGVDEEFSDVDPVCQFSMKIKYPSQGDCDVMYKTSSSLMNKLENRDIRSILQFEYIRLLVLARSWDVDKPLNNDSIYSLSPRIVQSIILKIRDIIGMDGII